MTQVDRRSHYRLPIRVPIFIKGADAEGKEFLELTHTIDLSASGACFLCQRNLHLQDDLIVSIPAPVDISGFNADPYNFKFPAKIIRIEDRDRSLKKRVSVCFHRLLYGKEQAGVF